VEPPQSSEL
jgi:coatomer subunit beta